ncbi:hypothetical protein EJ05DRAFT_506123 [Pseudovirgaria hyperparasitica]|uniref:Uncharacterized protein n=1 Tax=Pseudovirgaria hyperparasitica TaxID=470096 RepID=A0A6A6VR38_9PEZI|nr:uncharacterized protein EJ05DRAFT_506123 [Pseudovirgaria hyperparasitica]KAF2752359.1 hypothetical protein EJ05DRAFT_506123 [Pseudovirgaria hyperparasitica]
MNSASKQIDQLTEQNTALRWDLDGVKTYLEQFQDWSFELKNSVDSIASSCKQQKDDGSERRLALRPRRETASV